METLINYSVVSNNVCPTWIILHKSSITMIGFCITHSVNLWDTHVMQLPHWWNCTTFLFISYYSLYKHLLLVSLLNSSIEISGILFSDDFYILTLNAINNLYVCVCERIALDVLQREGDMCSMQSPFNKCIIHFSNLWVYNWCGDRKGCSVDLAKS